MVLLDEEILHEANISEAELLLEIAILLFQQHRLTLGKAARLAQISEAQFEQRLAQRNIPRYFYEMEDLDLDLNTLKKMRQS
jgi:predicted HTH domain antitoxin